MNEEQLRKHLLDFGNYILSEERTNLLKDHSGFSNERLLEERLSRVSNADIENYLDEVISNEAIKLESTLIELKSLLDKMIEEKSSTEPCKADQPKEVEPTEITNDQTHMKFYKCSVCKTDIHWVKLLNHNRCNYCSSCGVKFKWK